MAESPSGVALSRGRYSNRVYIYAAIASGWEETLATDRNHTFALHQHPTSTPTQHPPHPSTRTRPRAAALHDPDLVLA